MGWTEIGQKLGMPESTVRSMYQNGVGTKKDQAEKIAETLKKEVDKKGMIDISEGTNLTLGVSEGKLDEAVYILEAEHGYKRYGVGIKQPTNFRQQTNITVLAKPEYDQRYMPTRTSCLRAGEVWASILPALEGQTAGCTWTYAKKRAGGGGDANGDHPFRHHCRSGDADRRIDRKFKIQCGHGVQDRGTDPRSSQAQRLCGEDPCDPERHSGAQSQDDRYRNT